jgi:hypothetical protein
MLIYRDHTSKMLLLPLGLKVQVEKTVIGAIQGWSRGGPEAIVSKKHSCFQQHSPKAGRNQGRNNNRFSALLSSDAAWGMWQAEKS